MLLAADLDGWPSTRSARAWGIYAAEDFCDLKPDHANMPLCKQLLVKEEFYYSRQSVLVK